MAEREDDILSGADAERVWRLSAQLQAEATGSVEAPEVAGAHDSESSSGYPLTRVRSVAREAGIDDTFVDSALADLRAWQALSQVGRGHSLAWKLLGDPPDMVIVRRVIEAAVEEVVSAMHAVLPGEPFRLTLRDRQGDPQQGGALLFDLPAMKTPFERGFAFETSEAGLRQILVSIRPIEGSTGSCEMTVHSAMTAHNTGFTIGLLAATLTGAVGFGAFAALGVAVGGMLGLAAGVAPVAGVSGGLLGTVLGLKGFRGIYRLAVRRARGALDGLVGAVAARAEGVW